MHRYRKGQSCIGRARRKAVKANGGDLDFTFEWQPIPAREVAGSTPEDLMKQKHQIDREALTAARVFARTLPKESRQSLRRCLTSLNRLKRNGYRHCRLLLVGSWPEHSFGWAFLDRLGRIRFNGGLLLHGFEPTLAVTLESASVPTWQVHT